MFIDEAELKVKGGKGGDGCAAFRREKYVPRGGPDGGDGGNGGSVYVRATSNMTTLLDFAPRPVYEGGKGAPGRGKSMDGRNGEDLVLETPPGTLVRDKGTGRVLRDLTEPGERVCVARGGRGGRGNKHFATAIHRTPRECEEGREGEERTIVLELKLIADVGLVGLPNAGKSTLLSRVSSARPKIAGYPFTTLAPHLGIVEFPDFGRMVLADLPGLIEGAHAGQGLGDAFLKHVERTRMLCHVVDLAPQDGPTPPAAYRMIREELRLYSVDLASKPHVIAANKLDLPEASGHLEALRAEVDAPVYGISAATGAGVRELLGALRKELETPCSWR
jgi:GTP-binding protein